MPGNRQLIFSIARKRDFSVLACVFLVLALLSAVLSPQPAALAFLVILLLVAAWVWPALFFSEINDAKFTLIIFVDGRIRLNSDCENVAEGFLYRQQWYTRRVAVLTITTKDGPQSLVVLARQQGEDDFRRLNCWLRQGLFAKSEGRFQS